MVLCTLGQLTRKLLYFLHSGTLEEIPFVPKDYAHVCKCVCVRTRASEWMYDNSYDDSRLLALYGKHVRNM